jgi:hypothetical protein
MLGTCQCRFLKAGAGFSSTDIMSQHILLSQDERVHDCPNAGEGFCMLISDNRFDCSKQLLRDGLPMSIFRSHVAG